MSVIARVGPFPRAAFSIHHGDKLVADVNTVVGLDDALSATERAGGDSTAYVPGLHIAGFRSGAAWFTEWRAAGEKRDLTICDHVRARSVDVTGAFVSAWCDGSWCDLAIETAKCGPNR